MKPRAHDHSPNTFYPKSRMYPSICMIDVRHRWLARSRSSQQIDLQSSIFSPPAPLGSTPATRCLAPLALSCPSEVDANAMDPGDDDHSLCVDGVVRWSCNSTTTTSRSTTCLPRAQAQAQPYHRMVPFTSARQERANSPSQRQSLPPPTPGSKAQHHHSTMSKRSVKRRPSLLSNG